MAQTKFVKKNWLALLPLALLLARCTSPDAYKKVDVSKVEAPMHTLRFERDFFGLDVNNLAAGTTELQQKYGPFYNDYVLGIMAFGAPESRLDTSHRDPLTDIQGFLQNPSDRALYDSVQQRFSDFGSYEKNIQTGVQHFRFYFPDRPAPRVIYTFISEFGNAAITYGDTVIGVGLDMYLGENFAMYDGVNFPAYMKRKLRPEFIAPNAMEVLYNNYFDQTAYNAGLPLVEAMINEGKKYYFMECMLPDLPDSTLIGYTKAQEEWCRKSEKSIWQFFNEQDLLYKVNFMEQKRYTTDGPTTPGMPPESPGRIGSWLGWQIVRKYMRDGGGKISLKELAEKKSAKEILAKAGYKPK